MAYYVICASPLVKAFLNEWQDEVMENPDLLNDFKTDFTFDVPRNSGAVKIPFNKPIEVKTKDEKDTKALYQWLIGGNGSDQASETDCWGLVAFDPQQDLVGKIDRIALLEALSEEEEADPKKAAAKQAKITKDLSSIQKEIRNGLKGARDTALQKSQARIMRAMKVTANNLLRQWQINEESGLGKYPPSVSEHLSIKAYEEQIRKKNAKIYQSMEETTQSLKATFVK